MGNNYEVEYLVRPERLHSGRNYGAIRFVTPYETLTYEVEVLQNLEYDENHHVPELLYAQALKEYVGYIGGRIGLDDWVRALQRRWLRFGRSRRRVRCISFCRRTFM